MRYAITCEGVVIGYSAFEVLGTPRGLLRGQFVPAAAYERLRPLFPLQVPTLFDELRQVRASAVEPERRRSAERVLRFLARPAAGAVAARRAAARLRRRGRARVRAAHLGAARRTA